MTNSQNSPNLWPRNKINPVIKSPVMLLNNQASLLGQMTNEYVTASLVKEQKDDTEVYHFDIIGTVISKRARLFSIQYQKDLPYPCTVIIPQDPDYPPDDDPIANSEDEFKGIIAQYLSSHYVISTVNAYLAKTNEIMENEPPVPENWDSQQPPDPTK